MVKKKVKKDNKAVFYGFGFVFILVIAALIMGLTGFPNSTTGASIYVKSYGVSDELISTQSGKIQTLIKFTKPELKSLSTPAGREALVPGIIKQIDFETDILNIYKNDPWATISAGSLNGVATGAMKEAGNFKKNMRCFQKIGAGYRAHPNLNLVIISELKYQACRNKKDWSYGYLQHAFVEQTDASFICRQDNDKLFAVNDNNGDVTTDTTNC